MSIFRAYDIRGIAGKDLSNEIAEKIGRAFATYVGGGEIIVGYDARISSPELKNAVINGLVSAGCDVVDIGMVPTPLVYFAVSHFKKDGGVMITGSHNPPEYNGFKLLRGEKTLYGEEIQDIRKIIESGKFRKGSGTVREKNVIREYQKYIQKRVKLGKKLKAVIDCGNGAAGPVAVNLFENLGCEIIPLYCEPDGNFPNHHPDPTVDETLDDLVRTVKEEKADIGIAYDGDADRAGFVDDSGSIIRGDQALILFSREILKRERGAKIIMEVKCSQSLVEDIKKNGGIPIMYRTGHSFIKKKMREENALLAGEMSGHFFFADNYYGYDDAIFASARMAQIVSNSDKKLSEIISELPKYFSTPEIRIHCPEDKKFKIVQEITEKFRDRFNVVDVDGARIQFDDGWGLIRASNTEPALILRFEAKTESRMNEIKEIILKELRKYPEISKSLEGL